MRVELNLDVMKYRQDCERFARYLCISVCRTIDTPFTPVSGQCICGGVVAKVRWDFSSDGEPCADVWCEDMEPDEDYRFGYLERVLRYVLHGWQVASRSTKEFKGLLDRAEEEAKHVSAKIEEVRAKAPETVYETSK